jgi:hypothetical protein
MTLTEHALRGTAVGAGPPNRMRVGLPWYRSMPFSAVLGIELTVDDEPVPELTLRVDDAPVAVEALVALEDRSWFLQDRCALEWAAPVPAAALVDVVLRVRLQLPNLVGPDGSPVHVLQEVRGTVPVEVAQ